MGHADDFRTNAAGHLEIGGCDAVELAERFGTPLWVISEETIRANIRALAGAFEQVWPRTRVVYATKANPQPAIVAIALDEGALVDAVTLGHLRLIEAAGASLRDVVFNGNAKTPAELRHALDGEIAVINVDSLEEMELLASIAPRDAARRQPVCLRIAVDVRRHAADDPEMLRFEPLGKFGMDVPDLLAAAELGLAHPGLEVAGLHSHVGFTAYGTAYDRELALGRHRRCVEEVFDVAEALVALGAPPRIINMGGGFRVGTPDGYGPGKITSFPSADDYAEVIGGTVRDRSARLGIEPELYLEAGGWCVSDAIALLGTVGLRKTRRLGEDERRWAFLENTSSYHFVRRTMFDFYHRVVVANRMGEPAAGRLSIAGPICAGDDVCIDEPLPAVERGDLVAVLDNGAYCESVTSDYCSVPIPGAVLVRDGSAELVRRPETVEDIAARFDVPARLARGVGAGR